MLIWFGLILTISTAVNVVQRIQKLQVEIDAVKAQIGMTGPLATKPTTGK